MDVCLCVIVQYILLFINVLNTERAKRARKKYVAPYQLPDRFALTFLVLPCFWIAKHTMWVQNRDIEDKPYARFDGCRLYS